MTGISIEQVVKDLWFRGDDGTLVTAAVCLVLGRDDRNNMLIIPEKRHLGMVLAQIDIIEACRHKPPQVYGLLACLHIQQHLCRRDAARIPHQAETSEELLGGGVGRHPHISRTIHLMSPSVCRCRPKYACVFTSSMGLSISATLTLAGIFGESGFSYTVTVGTCHLV